MAAIIHTLNEISKIHKCSRNSIKAGVYGKKISNCYNTKPLEKALQIEENYDTEEFNDWYTDVFYSINGSPIFLKRLVEFFLYVIPNLFVLEFSKRQRYTQQILGARRNMIRYTIQRKVRVNNKSICRQRRK